MACLVPAERVVIVSAHPTHDDKDDEGKTVGENVHELSHAVFLLRPLECFLLRHPSLFSTLLAPLFPCRLLFPSVTTDYVIRQTVLDYVSPPTILRWESNPSVLNGTRSILIGVPYLVCVRSTVLRWCPGEIAGIQTSHSEGPGHQITAAHATSCLELFTVS